MDAYGPDSSDSFNDPDLKSAVRRAWAGERAPAELRGRVAAAITSDAGRAAQAPPPAEFVHDSAPVALRRVAQRGRSPLFSLAAAALLLLAVGAVVYRLGWPAARPT